MKQSKQERESIIDMFRFGKLEDTSRMLTIGKSQK